MSKNKSIEHILQRLSTWEKPFNFTKPTVIKHDIAAYLNYYGLNIADVAFHFGKIETNGTKTMVQMFAPKESKGTIFLLHGYLDHVGHLKYIIQFLNKHGFTVISYDLEGHGLSEGKTASVQRFSDYVHSLEKLMDLTKKEMPGPFYVIGHSTGGAIAIDYVLQHHDHVFDKVILAAPLVHSAHWYGTVLGYYMAKVLPLLEEVKRNFRVNSSNQHYLEARKLDPLQTEVIPLDWVGAMLHWNKLLDHYPPTNTPTFVIQGNKDNTVAWQYNLKFIEEKFPHAKMVQIDNGRHALFNESEEIRELVFSFVNKFIEEK
ncbi:lysophospholipase [Thalassobacillus cyri]|uniref:Lysophospholipase n=1 Tax=Thalassobacillus cyri TaxID=571932 RepID=A0A1H4FP61_9BACI|nr:alpha/beta hydrolase [Thalassobacillus cyri]SEA99149.1 lysophospholipase [Thalassobacillus cyri]